jgi:hypothetical protein
MILASCGVLGLENWRWFLTLAEAAKAILER